jgi:hypothetical protein
MVVWMLSCDRTIDCPECFTPPQELNLKITDYTTATDLIFNNSISRDSIELFFYENGNRKLLEHEIYIDSVNSKAILICYEISWKSANGIKDFYLCLGDNDIDSINLDVERKSNDCCTYFEWKAFKINGNDIHVDLIDYVYNYKKTAANK